MGRLKYLWEKVFKLVLFPANGEQVGILRKKAEKDRRVFKWCIYGDDYSMKQWGKDFYHIHVNIKNRLLIPFLHLLIFILGDRKLYKVRPHRAHDKNFVAFDRAFDGALKDWTIHYVVNIKSKIGKRSREEYIKWYLTSKSCQLLRMIKKVFFAFICSDTAYREFFNMLLFNIAKEMNNLHDTETITHVPYICKEIVDMRYFVLWESTQGNLNKVVKGELNGHNNKKRT